MAAILFVMSLLFCLRLSCMSPPGSGCITMLQQEIYVCAGRYPYTDPISKTCPSTTEHAEYRR